MVVHFVILSLGFMQFANFTGIDVHWEIKKDSAKQGVWLVHAVYYDALQYNNVYI